MSPPDPADDPAVWLERVRQSGIRVDREGRFVHEGSEVTHEGLRRALFRWLDRLPPPDGRYVLRLDAERFAYLDVDDTPLVARAARIDPDGRVLLALSDGTEEPLDPETLTVDDEGTAAGPGPQRASRGPARELGRGHARGAHVRTRTVVTCCVSVRRIFALRARPAG